MLVTEDNWGKVIRAHFSRPLAYPTFEIMGLISIENYSDDVHKEISIRRGSIHIGEGMQLALLQQRVRSEVRSLKHDVGIDVHYDENGDIIDIYYGQLMPKDETESHESVLMNFRVENRLPTKQTGSGAFQVSDGDGFAECVKTIDGEVILRYRVPKKIDIDQILEKLVPADLRDYPYDAPAAADTAWRETDLLRAFGIERII